MTAAYVERLPDGFASFPEARVRAEVFEALRVELFERGLADSELPQEMRTYIRDGVPSKWLDEALAQACNSLLCDVLGTDEFLQWSYSDAARLYHRPLMRHLMRLVSPSLLAMGAPSRWNTLRDGSHLEIGKLRRTETRIEIDGALIGPDHLFAESFLLAMAEAFRAALEGARGREVQAKLRESSANQARYELSWAR